MANYIILIHTSRSGQASGDYRHIDVVLVILVLIEGNKLAFVGNVASLFILDEDNRTIGIQINIIVLGRYQLVGVEVNASGLIIGTYWQKRVEWFVDAGQDIRADDVAIDINNTKTILYSTPVGPEQR